jgi:hypothetical protein
MGNQRKMLARLSQKAPGQVWVFNTHPAQVPHHRQAWAIYDRHAASTRTFARVDHLLLGNLTARDLH